MMTDWLNDWLWIIHFSLPVLTVFLIRVKLGHEIVEGATVVACAISPDQSSSMEKGRKGMHGALQEEAITSETREGLESQGGGGRSDAEDSVRAEEGAAAAALYWGWSPFIAGEWVPWITISAAIVCVCSCSYATS